MWFQISNKSLYICTSSLPDSAGITEFWPPTAIIVLPDRYTEERKDGITQIDTIVFVIFVYSQRLVVTLKTI